MGPLPLPGDAYVQSGATKFRGAKMFDFRQATVFCLGYRPSKHKMTRYANNLGGVVPWAPLATLMHLFFSLKHFGHF